MSSKHIYHYNITAEQRYFFGRDHRNLCDLISLNANIVAYNPEPVAAFVATSAKPFIIDPQTHAFQHNPNNLKRDVRTDEQKQMRLPPILRFKESILSLANNYLREPFTKVIEHNTELTPSDFLDNRNNINQALIENVCNNTITFQQNVLNSNLSEEDRELLESNNFVPEILLAPYFYLEGPGFRDWLRINASLYEKAKLLFNNYQVYLPLVISKNILETSGIIEVIEMVKRIRPDGINLWIDDYEEEKLSKKQIGIFIQLLIQLNKITPNIFNSHGGYFSILLCHPELSLLKSVGHSINYGEHRSVIPVGGGIPKAPFYFPSIHSRLKFENALEIVKGKRWLSDKECYNAKVCACAQCEQLINENESIEAAFDVFGQTKLSKGKNPREVPIASAKQAASRHYLFNKANEFASLEIIPISDLIGKMNLAYNEVSSLIGEEYQHLRIWSESLSEIIN